jgi:signal transduction histidine kinase/ActR/RegA family two-component response regulator
MRSFEFVDQIASAPQRRAVLGLSALLALSSIALTPYADVQGPALAHVAGIYGAAAAVLNLSTFLLLSLMPAEGRVHRIIAAAYLYSGLMALVHLLTFPGAILPGRGIVGSANAVGWLFIAWRGGFPLWILWAVLAGDGGTGRRTRWDRPLSAPLFAVGAVLVLFVAAHVLAMPAYFPAISSARFSAISNVAAYGCALAAGLVVLSIWRQGLMRRALYLWIVLGLVADAAGLWLSTFGGGRYTVGWYFARVEGVLAAGTALVILALHVRALQASTVQALAALGARTETLQAEIQRRERAERMLLQSQKLEAVGQLAAGLAHDFNNLMQVIVGRAMVIRRRAGPVVDEDVEVIRRNIRRAEGLTRQLMLFSGRRQLQAKTVLLQQLLPELTAMFASLVRADVALELDAPPNTWPVHLDPAELEVALANLVTNARDALPQGGTIRIELRNELSPDGDSAGGVALAVRDNGAGIPPGVLERVFEPFFTTKEAGRGTGLGLSQVYAFAKASGGGVVIDSSTERGTVVTLRFPRAAEVPVAAAGAEALPELQGQRGQLVLVVDDNDEVRQATILLLEHGGFAVRGAAGAEEALARLREGWVPDALLSDIVMPGKMDGVALAHRVREEVAGIGVVLATGYSDAAERARDQGFIVLQKPYEAQDLAEALRLAQTVVPITAARREVRGS